MYSALEDITIQAIDFEWIKCATKVSHLKKAIRLIEADGDFFKELKEACYIRLTEIDPSQKRILSNQSLSAEQKQLIESQVKEWQSTTHDKPLIKQCDLEDYEGYFQKSDRSVLQKEKAANNEKIKGNEAMKSKDFDEAIIYYGKCLQIAPNMHLAYGNRALAYLKKKQYNKCIEDCEKALKLDKNYSKGYHRKAKALIGLKQKVQGYRCLQEIIHLEPENSEVNKQMKDLRQQMTENQRKQLQSALLPKTEFKKIIIQEDSDDQIQS